MARLAMIWAQVDALEQAPVGGLEKKHDAAGQHAMRRLAS
jgi:hypothetical protein